MFGKKKKPRSRESRLRSLAVELDDAVRDRQFKDALELVLLLEGMEPRSHRWPHKRGDILRKLNRDADAVDAYECAVFLYAEMGFLPRAIAMAKVILDIDPKRTDILEQIDPSAARTLHRKVRPEAVHAGEEEVDKGVFDSAEDLVPLPAPAAETKFSAVPDDRDTLDIDLQDVEFADREAEDVEELDDFEEVEAEDGPQLAEDFGDQNPPDETEDEARAEASRQACLPFFPLFAEAPREAMLALAKESELVRLSDGLFVIRMGEPADALYGIIEGAVRVVVPGLPESRHPRLAGGDVFGEACLLGNEPRRADVRAEGDLLALRIPKETLNYLVRAHAGLAEVLIEMMTRRQLGNFVHTSDLFTELNALARRMVASEFEIRRAKIGTTLVERGKQADGMYITLTGHVEVEREAGAVPAVEGAGVMFGHVSTLANEASQLTVRTRDTMLVLRLPAEALARIAIQHPAILDRIANLEPVARVSN